MNQNGSTHSDEQCAMNNNNENTNMFDIQSNFGYEREEIVSNEHDSDEISQLFSIDW